MDAETVAGPGEKPTHLTKPNLTQENRRMTFHLTQALSGHGCFNSYLFKRSRADFPCCFWCPGVREDSENTLFDCARYAPKRAQLLAEMGRTERPEDVQALLCGTARTGSTNNDVPGQNIIFTEARRRELFVGMIFAILMDKEAEEQARQQESSRGNAPGRDRNEGRRRDGAAGGR